MKKQLNEGNNMTMW